MNLAADILRDYIKRNGLSQYQFADACDVNQSLINQVLHGEILISQRNIAKLLAGLKEPTDKIRFLVAHLNDQVPSEHVHDVKIDARNGDHDGDGLDVAGVTELFSRLPNQTKGEVLRFLAALMVDPTLREVFRGVMRYVPTPTPRKPRTAATVSTSGPFPVEIMAKILRKQDANKSSRVSGKQAQPAPSRSRSAQASKTK